MPIVKAKRPQRLNPTMLMFRALIKSEQSILSEKINN